MLSSGEEESPTAMEEDLIAAEAGAPRFMRKPCSAPVLRKPSAAPVLRKPSAAPVPVLPRGRKWTFVMKNIPQRGKMIVQIRCVEANRAAIQVQGTMSDKDFLVKAGGLLLAAAESKVWTTFDQCKLELATLKASDEFRQLALE